MTNAAVRGNLLQASDVVRNLSTKIPLYAVPLLNKVTHGTGFAFREIPDALPEVHAGLPEDPDTEARSNPIQTREGNAHVLLVGQDNACDANGHDDELLSW